MGNTQSMLGGQGRGGAALRTILALAAGLVIVACGSDDDGSPDDGAGEATTDTAESANADETEGTGEPDDADAPVEQTVPADVATLELEALCFAVAEPPTQVSVTPEGHLWLRQDDQTWRVIDPFGHDEIQVLPSGVEHLQAWSHDRALVIDQGGLWDVQGQWPQPLAWPEGLAVPTRMCGDPSRDANGFVLADGLLHRDGGQWWEWTDPADESWTDVAWMARSAGACIGGDGELWLAEGDGEVWRITSDFATRVDALDRSEEAVLVDGLGVAALLDGAVIAGDLEALTRYHFEAGAASMISSGGQSLWVVVGDSLYRLRDGEFTVTELADGPLEAGSLHADAAGGVWTLTADQACHRRPTPPVRIEGVHNLERLVSETLELAVEVSPGASLTTATLDGEALPVEPAGGGRWLIEPQTITEGWHTLEVLAESDEGDTARRLRFEQRRVGDLTWARDVEPLFVEHCSGAACHGHELDDATRPDLSTWDAWIEREDSILERVVTRGDMPPAQARKDTWGLGLQLLVSEWFETGAQRGDD